MTINPKISIVTPSFNQGKYLEKTILSVLEQGYPNFEYIIIDGGSTDNSVEIIKKYEQHLKYWVSESDRGQSHAINKGFEHTTGDLLAWLNSDDWYAPGALTAVAELYAANSDVGAVVGAGEMVDEAGNRMLYNQPLDVTIDTLFGWLKNFFWQPSCFFTKNAWDNCGPVDEDAHYAMDLDLWLKIARKYRFVITNTLISTSLNHDKAKMTEHHYEGLMEAAFVITKNGGEKQVRQDLKDYANHLREKERGLLWQIANREEQLAEKEKQLAEKEKQLAEKGKQLWMMNEDLANLNEQIASLYSSQSWKLTAPLRALNAKLKLILGGHNGL